MPVAGGEPRRVLRLAEASGRGSLCTGEAAKGAEREDQGGARAKPGDLRQPAGVSGAQGAGARGMREHGGQIPCEKQGSNRSSRKDSCRATTQSDHPHPVADNLLDRDFTAPAPNRKWTCDITYIWTEQGWLYLAIVMDLFSRRIVGWSMRSSLHATLVIEAVQMAVKQHRPGAGLLHHSDRGVQYACHDYRELLAGHEITCSMSRTGNCYDNAVTESFFGTLKSEHVHHQHYKTVAQAMLSVFEWIEVFYNRQRRHSSLGYLSPETSRPRTTEPHTHGTWGRSGLRRLNCGAQSRRIFDTGHSGTFWDAAPRAADAPLRRSFQNGNFWELLGTPAPFVGTIHL